MDFSHSQQIPSTHHSNLQQNQQASTAPSHLPDENDIEKLFPKCQPKQPSNYDQYKSNGRLRLQSSLARNYRQQQHQQQQQQQQQLQYPPQQQRRHSKSYKTHNYNRKNFEYKSSRSNTLEFGERRHELPHRLVAKQENPSFVLDLKQKRRTHFDSSDSQDEPNQTEQHQISGIRRSATASCLIGDQRLQTQNSYEQGIRSTSGQGINQKVEVNSTQGADNDRSGSVVSLQSYRNSRSARKSKRHIATRKPYLPINGTSPNQNIATEVVVNEPQLVEVCHDIDSSCQTPSIDTARRCISARDKHDASSQADVDDCAAPRKVEKVINRTSRGIVFLDSVEANLQRITADQTGSIVNNTDRTDNETNSNLERSNLASELVSGSTPTQSIAQARSEPEAHADRSYHSRETADCMPSDIRSNDEIVSRAEPDTSAISSSESLQHTHKSEQKAENAYLMNEVLSTDNETTLKDTQDDDRYINLFVYDNSPPSSSKDKDAHIKDKNSLEDIEQSQNVNALQDLKEGEVLSLHHRESHQLLADQIEPEADVVHNDTSIEELCNLEESSKEKQKLIDLRSKRLSDNDIPSRLLKEVDATNPTSVKPILKHHRSLGTLQPVDEKAEITIEATDDRETDVKPKADVAMFHNSDIDQLRKGFSPPGFPLRVKTAAEPREACKSPSSNEENNIAPKPNASALSSSSQIHQDVIQTDLDAITKQYKHSEAILASVTQKSSEDNLVESETLASNIKEPNCSLSKDKTMICEQTKVAPTTTKLVHNKLPNELSHYSVVRTQESKKLTSLSKLTNDEQLNSSKLQFSNLSDGDSDPGTRPDDFQKSTSSNKPNRDLVKFVQPASGVVYFPKLDEGLSDEIESCDDGVDDDVDDVDEQAMEADIEDGDLDDDIDGPIKTNLDRLSFQPTAELDSMKNQQSKHHNRNNLLSSDIDGQGKSSVAPYMNYSGHHDNAEQTELKSQTNYLNQNGQQNYWMNNQSQQATLSQPGSSQYSIQKCMLNGSSIPGVARNSNLTHRDDAKAASRLSSDTDNETDRLLGTQRTDQLQKMGNDMNSSSLDTQPGGGFKQNSNSREVLIEGVLFNVKYLGSTHTDCEGRGEKEDRINQAEMAVHEVKFRNGDTSIPIEVQLFISTEKIMVLDDKHRKIMMDHSLRTISYIADIGDAIVLIVRKKGTNLDISNDLNRTIPKTTCHVFESPESHTITKSISQAFQVAYTELLKANGGDVNGYLPKELDYQEVLNSQEMSMTELDMFARKDNEREVIVPKQKGEILGISIVESGWGSVLPTAVIASLKQDGPAYRCKKLSVGDQILSINGISLVGLSQAECQEILRKTHDQRVARLSVVPCPITVEVKIKRPDTKYQLGFSVQNGVICSLLRGGIAERGGVRVGHRIMSINGTTVVDVPHDKIVTLLASSVGEIRMKTCLTSLYRHMLGEEKAVFL